MTAYRSMRTRPDLQTEPQRLVDELREQASTASATGDPPPGRLGKAAEHIIEQARKSAAAGLWCTDWVDVQSDLDVAQLGRWRGHDLIVAHLRRHGLAVEADSNHWWIRVSWRRPWWRRLLRLP